MTRGRVPKSVKAVEEMAVEVWRHYGGFSCSAARSEMFGAHTVLMLIGEKRAADLALFLSHLAGELACGDLPAPVQSDLSATGGGWLK